ncbi:hypothetical protein PYCC9005_005762 [Savitreella phatthalungensis]
MSDAGLDEILGGGPSSAEDYDLSEILQRERLAPELLPFASFAVEQTLAGLRERLEELETSGTNALASIILQTDVERTRWLVRSYMRTRISKIDRFPTHYNSLDRDDLLSPLEKQYLTRHVALLASHYDNAGMRDLPPQLRRLDDKAAAGVSMVDTPDLDRAVFCMIIAPALDLRVRVTVREDAGDGAGTRGEGVWRQRMETLHAKAGQTMLLPYASVKQYVLSGEVQLI